MAQRGKKKKNHFKNLEISISYKVKLDVGNGATNVMGHIWVWKRPLVAIRVQVRRKEMRKSSSVSLPQKNSSPSVYSEAPVTIVM